MRQVLFGIGLGVVWALVGWTQCSELPYTIGGTTVTLRFCGNLTVSGGTCSQVASNVLQCSVPEGTTGTVSLSAQRTPAGTVSIGATVLPGWAAFTSVSGWGSVSGQCWFAVPAGTAGQRFELRFRATAAGVPGEILLTVILDVTAAPVGPQLYGPFTETTDDAGKFTVPVPGLPNNVRVGGTLTECTVRVLPRTPVTIYVAATAPVQPPSFGHSGFVWASYPATPVAQQAPSIAYILISTPGYPQMRVPPVRIIPIIVGGTTYTMVDLGTVSFPALACATRPPDGEISGRTDGEGKFTVNVGSGTTVSGRLTECTVKPLPNQTFTVIPVFSAGELSEVSFVVPGYPDTAVTKVLSVLRLGAMTYVNLGDVCLLPTGPEGDRREGEISGKTDSDGRFTTTLSPGTVASGRLTVCTVTPLADQPFTVTPIRDATGEVGAFEFRVPGHADTKVIEFSMSSLFGLFTTYDVGDVYVSQTDPGESTDCPDCTFEEDLVGPYRGKTDEQGRFSVQIREPLSLDVGGQLVKPEAHPLQEATFYLYLEPQSGLTTTHSFLGVASFRFLVTGFETAYVGLHVDDLTLVGLVPTVSIGPPIFLNVSDTGCTGYARTGACTRPGDHQFRIIGETSSAIRFVYRICYLSGDKGHSVWTEWRGPIVHSRTEGLATGEYRVFEDRKGNSMEYTLTKGEQDGRGGWRWVYVTGVGNPTASQSVRIHSSKDDLPKGEDGGCTPKCGYAIVERTERNTFYREWYKCDDSGRWVRAFGYSERVKSD